MAAPLLCRPQVCMWVNEVKVKCFGCTRMVQKKFEVGYINDFDTILYILV